MTRPEIDLSDKPAYGLSDAPERFVEYSGPSTKVLSRDNVGDTVFTPPLSIILDLKGGFGYPAQSQATMPKANKSIHALHVGEVGDSTFGKDISQDLPGLPSGLCSQNSISYCLPISGWARPHLPPFGQQRAIKSVSLSEIFAS